MKRNFSSTTAALAALALAGLTLATVAPTTARAQALEDIATAGLPTWSPGRAVTTSINDALPVVTGLKGVDDDLVQPIPDNWTFAPGYYRSVIRSYCLHAGAYGPTKGDGYLIAPLKGDRVPLIRNILLRSTMFPKIEQHDVQRLIWGTEDGAQWNNYDDAFKSRVAPLLSAEEIAILNMEPQRQEIANQVKRRLGGLIPGGARHAVDTYADLRSRITSTTSYTELENIAVKTGVAPWGKDSRQDVAVSPWAYVGNGFFLRAFPSGYPTTTLEIYRVAPAKITRDAKGRITHFDSDGYVIDTSYVDTPATEAVDGRQVPVWRFKTVTFRNPDGRTYTAQHTGYIVAEQPHARGVSVAAAVNLAFAARTDDGGLDDMGHYRDGLKKAFNPTDKKGQLGWIQNHLGRLSAAWDAATSALAGDSQDAKPAKFDPSHYTATPANTSKQRLALSAFKK